MKRFINAILIISLLLASVPFSAYAKTGDMEIVINPDGFSEKSYSPTYSGVGQITLMSEDETLPSSFDARDYGWVTPLKDQTWGTCNSHAILSTIETYNISQGLDDITADYSESHLHWFSNTKITNENDPTYGDGITIYFNPDDYLIGEWEPDRANEVGNYVIGISHNTAIGTLAKWSGIANEADFSPVSEGLPIDENYRYNTDSGFVIKSAEWLNDITDVKKWVKNYGSATIAFSYGDMNSAGLNASVTWNDYEYDPYTASLHAVAIIGWDDSFPMREIYSYIENYGYPELMPPADGAWLCKDSNGFYLWISYYDPSIIEIVGYTAQPSSNYRENYTYNGLGSVARYSVTDEASIANVFKTDEYEILSAVSTYTCTVNQELVIKVYTDLTDNYSDPTQGTLALEYPVTILRTGYHTIELPQDIRLNPNSYFSVVVDYYNPNGKATFPAEYDYYDTANDMEYNYSSNRGESFVFENGAWFYSEDAYPGMRNIYVQAFTNCDHQPETTAVPASCKETGYTETRCTQCSEVLESSIIPKLKHENQWVVETAPTATTDGSKKQVCKICGDETDLQKIPATGFEALNGMAVDYTNDIIYGFDAGVNSLDKYTEIVADGYEWIYTEGKNGFGTGTKAVLKNGNETVAEYTILIFGDINGDGWYDGEDAFLVNLIVAGMLDRDDVSEAIWTAADCNHDGEIDGLDVDLLTGAGLLLNKVDQSATQTALAENADYIEYAMLIDQSAGMTPGISPDVDDSQQDTTDTNATPAVSTEPISSTNWFELISEIIRWFFSAFLFVSK